MNPSDRILALVTEALDMIDARAVPLSTVIRRGTRIARLRNDFVSLWWLEWEMVDITDKQQRFKIHQELSSHFPSEMSAHYLKFFSKEWVAERSCAAISDDGNMEYVGKILARGVSEIEIEVARYRQIASGAQTPAGLHPLDLYFVDQSNSDLRSKATTIASSYQSILARIRQRVHVYLSQTETQLMFGQLHSDIFYQYRQHVDLRLGQLCPDALEKFVAAYGSMQENTPESRSHALTSCRRLLKSLADVLYPPSDKPVVGVDGKPRALTEDKDIARLWQYVFEQTARSASGNLLVAQTTDLGNRLDRLYDLACKGVHAEVSEVEVSQCVIQTYLLAGDLVRIFEKQPSLSEEKVR
jgi:hypothetical protein